MIDGVFIIVLLYGFTLLFDTIGSVPDYFKKITFLFCFVLYEPLFISLGSTLGQSLMEIRVRSFSNPEKRINIFQAFLRFFVKIFLGWASFITVTFNVNRRAIHDLASGSIMITKKGKKE